MAMSSAMNTEQLLVDEQIEAGVSTFLKMRDSLVSSYNDSTYANGTAFFGFIKPSGEFLPSRNTACHADLKYLPYKLSPEDALGFLILNSIQDSPLDVSDQRNWINWLINMSMFAPHFVIHDVDWCMDNKCVIMSPDAPVNVLALGMFMIRSISEHQNIAEGLLTSRLLNRGVEPQMAYFLSHWFNYSGGSVTFSAGRGNNHVYVPFRDLNWDDVRNWLLGQATNPGAPYRENSKYSCISGMFSANGDRPNIVGSFMSSRFTNRIQVALRDGTSTYSVHISPFAASKGYARVGVSIEDRIKMNPDVVADYLVTLIPDILKEVKL